MPKRKRTNPSYSKGLAPTKERARQNGGTILEVVREESNGKIYVKRRRAAAECTIDYYFAQARLSFIEHKAATLFRRDYQRAILKIKTDDYSAGSHGDKEMPVLAFMQSEKRLREAYAALSSAQKSIIIKACGHDDWIGDTYRFETFQRGLAQLIKLWGLSQTFEIA